MSNGSFLYIFFTPDGNRSPTARISRTSSAVQQKAFISRGKSSELSLEILVKYYYY